MEGTLLVLQQVHEVVFKAVVSGVFISALFRMSVDEVRSVLKRRSKRSRK